MRAEWIEHTADLDSRVLEQWRVLAIQQGKPYCLPEWMLAWWRHAAPPDARLRILQVTDGDDLIGVGPFHLDRRFGLSNLRILGAGTSSGAAPLAADGARQELAAAIRELLLGQRQADVAMLEGVPVEARWLDELFTDRPSPAGKLYPVKGWLQPNPTLSMPENGYDRWFESKGAKFRARMRRGDRQLASLGGRHHLSEGTAEILSRLSEFERLHELRWKARGGSDVLSRAVAGFLEDFAQSSPENLRVWSVDVNDRTVSVQLLVAAGGTICHWLGGIDESFSGLHPGAGVLGLHAAIEHAWKAADHTFDFGAGGQPFKYRFADGEYQLEWSGAARARWCTIPAHIPGLGARTRLAVTRRLSPESKRRLRFWQRKIRRLSG